MEPETKKPKLENIIYENNNLKSEKLKIYKKILDVITLPEGFSLINLDRSNYPIFSTTNDSVPIAYCCENSEGIFFDPQKLVSFAKSRYAGLKSFSRYDLKKLLMSIRWHPLVLEFANKETYAIEEFRMKKNSCLMINVKKWADLFNSQRTEFVEKYKVNCTNIKNPYISIPEGVWLCRM